MSESNYVFMLRAGGAELEVQYHEQKGEVYISEAQLFLKGDHVEGGCLFFIDEVYDMDKFIAYLSEIRDKMYKHYDAKSGKTASPIDAVDFANRFNGKFQPKCTECGKLQTKEEIGVGISICFDCEKKGIINNANRTVDNYVEQLKSNLTPEQKELIDGKANPVVDLKESSSFDDKICDWPGCGQMICKKSKPKGWEQGHCLKHDKNRIVI